MTEKKVLDERIMSKVNGGQTKEEYFAEKGLKEVEEEIEDQDIVLEAVEEFMEKKKSRRK